MLRAGHQRPHVLAKDRLAPNGDRVQRRPVEGVPHRDRLVSARGNPGKLQGHADRFGSPGTQQDLVQIPRSDLGKLPGKIDGDPVGVSPGAEGKGVELRLDGRHHIRIGETHLMDIVPVEIHVAASLNIFDPDSTAALQSGETGGREGLPQKVSLVFRQQRPGLRVQILLLPLSAPVRDIDVAFRTVKLFHRGSPPYRIAYDNFRTF